jgi:hypothetical protein
MLVLFDSLLAKFFYFFIKIHEIATKIVHIVRLRITKVILVGRK